MRLWCEDFLDGEFVFVCMVVLFGLKGEEEEGECVCECIEDLGWKW